ncbi:MAG: hypothetical protein IKL79_00440 [Clostridia bacterium]|nr:hypothetical protein [Clostridia bacterium]MBR3680454.1 hypothetical protein [Clostridia bacterium]
MHLFTRAASIAVIVFRAVWTVVATLLWILGLIYFIDDTRFMTWFAWGVMCAIPLCVEIIKNAIDSARRGAHRGSHEYTITYYDTHAEVRDNSASGCLWGFVGGLLGGLFIGPVILPLYIFGIGATTVSDIILFVRSK